MNKVGGSENISKLLTPAIRMQTFLGSDLRNKSFAYDDYRTPITPYVENMLLLQNPSVHKNSQFAAE